MFWAASDVGWVVGHSYITYGPLVAREHDHRIRRQAHRHPRCRDVLARDRANTRCKQLLHRPPPPFARSNERTPRASSIKKYDLSGLRAIYLAGERADPDTIEWTQDTMTGKPVYDHWWQTETGWTIVRQPRRDRGAARQARLAHGGRCPAMTCRSLTRAGTR